MFGVFVAVDGDYVLGRGAAGHVLACAGYADGYVQVGRDGLAGQAHLVAVVNPSGRPQAARDAPSAPPSISLSSPSVSNGSGPPSPASAAYYDGRVFQSDAFGLLRLGLYKPSLDCGFVQFDGEALNVAGAGCVGFQRLERLGTH